MLFRCGFFFAGGGGAGGLTRGTPGTNLKQKIITSRLIGFVWPYIHISLK
jgi:hypothetical protein